MITGTLASLQAATVHALQTPGGGELCPICKEQTRKGKRGERVLLKNEKLTVMEMTRPCEKSTSSDTILCRASGARGGAEEYLSGRRESTTDSFSSPALTG